MTDFNRVLRQLRTNKTQTEQQLKKLAQAITVLEEISGETRGPVRATRKVTSRRKVSKSARNRMAAAQRARWAKVRQQQKAA